jgi:hypothetical protein
MSSQPWSPTGPSRRRSACPLSRRRSACPLSPLSPPAVHVLSALSSQPPAPDGSTLTTRCMSSQPLSPVHADDAVHVLSARPLSPDGSTLTTRCTSSQPRTLHVFLSLVIPTHECPVSFACMSARDGIKCPRNPQGADTPRAANCRLAEVVLKPASVRVVAHDLLTAIAACHKVVNRDRILKA